jgi:hypothetical protein
MDAAGDIFSGLLELLAEVVIRLLELLFYVVENIVYGVLWLCRCSKFAGPRRKKRLPEETRYLIRSCLHSLLALGLVGLVVYFGWLRKPAPKTPPSPPAAPTKIEKAQKVFEKAKQIKERLLPPKTEP